MKKIEKLLFCGEIKRFFSLMMLDLSLSLISFYVVKKLVICLKLNLKNKKIIKCYYRSSVISLVKFKDVVNLGGKLVELFDVLYIVVYNIMIKKNIYKEIKE